MNIDTPMNLAGQRLIIDDLLPKIYPITDTRITNLSHAAQVEKLIEGGAKFIQLREKYASSKDFYEQAKEALKIARKMDVKIIINDRVDIALALGADGVHLGQDDLPPEFARKILGEKAIIGFSTHNLQQAADAVKLPIDYLAIGPVFATKTKENPDEICRYRRRKKCARSYQRFPARRYRRNYCGKFSESFRCGRRFGCGH